MKRMAVLLVALAACSHSAAAQKPKAAPPVVQVAARDDALVADEYSRLVDGLNARFTEVTDRLDAAGESDYPAIREVMASAAVLFENYRDGLLTLEPKMTEPARTDLRSLLSIVVESVTMLRQALADPDNFAFRESLQKVADLTSKRVAATTLLRHDLGLPQEKPE